MSQVNEKKDDGRDSTAVYVVAADLPVHCPTEAMGLWNTHPRVFIPLQEADEACCPYCGTRFILDKEGSAADQ